MSVNEIIVAVLKIFIKLSFLLAGGYFFVRMILIKKGKNMPEKGYKKKLKSQKGKAARKEKLKKWLKIIAVIAIIGFMVGVVIFASLFAYYAKDLPNPEKVNRRVVAESTKIYDRTGEHLLYELFGEEKRTIIPLEEIPESLKYATIVLEDRDFYDHHGIDSKGLIKATCYEVSRKLGMGNLGGICPRRGGSTITQQFIKNSILTSERKYSRKIKEIILALEIEQKFEKDEILRMYLNEIPYGSNAYGIESASQTFFGVHAKDLTLAQSVLLARLPQRPSYFSPNGSNTDELLNHWRRALDDMAKLGYITEEQAEAAKNEDILGQIKPLRTDIRAPHFSLYVRDKLVEEFGEEEIQKNGYKIFTTLDWETQQTAEKSVREGVEEHGDRWGFENAALVATNPKNGQVLAMVGSRDYFAEDIDGNVNVAIRLRQPGSSFKPYVYAEGLRKGYRPDTQMFDVLTEFSVAGQKNYRPENYNKTYYGPVKLKDALARSLNVPAVKMLYLAGLNDSIKLAKSMGITTLNNPGRYGLALVLGGGEVKLVEHVGAFAVFANDGIKHDQRVILRIEDANGKLIKDYGDSKGKRVLEKEVANQITDILSKEKLRESVFGKGSNLHVPDRSVAAKTGTTNEYRDGWLVGAAPSLAAGVWAGNNDNTKMKEGAAGINVAGPIWNSFMVEALRNHKNEKFSDPPDYKKLDKDKKIKPIIKGDFDFVEEIKVCKDEDGDYCLENSSCPDKKVKEKKYFVGHSILYYVNKDDPLGDKPKKPKDDPQFKNWEAAVVKWAEKHADDKGRDPAPTKECDDDDFDD